MTSVLWYSNETPDVHGQGGQRRQYFQIRSLVRSGHEVTVVSLEGEQDDESIRALTEVRRLPSVRRTARIPVGTRNREARRLLGSVDCERVVVAHLESWEHLRRRRLELPHPRLIDLHNVFSGWHSTHGTRSGVRRWRRLERAAATHFDAWSVCSTREQSAFLHSTGSRAMLLPHGIEPEEWTVAPAPRSKPVLKLFGNWGWEPNRRGLRWFLAEVAPGLVSTTGVTIDVAGTGTGSFAAPDGVTFLGRVEDVPAFVSDAWCIVVPVLAGVGAPVKYREALATGLPVLATSDATDGTLMDEVFVSDDPTAWIDHVAAVIREPDRHWAAAALRRRSVLEELSWDRASEELCQWVQSDLPATKG